MKKHFILMLFAFLAIAKSMAQCDSSQIKVTIYFKTDTFPSDLAYSLRNTAGKIYAQRTYGYFKNPNTLYTQEICVPKNECFRMTVNNQSMTGFGIYGTKPGHCVVTTGGKDTVVKILYFESIYHEFFNCPKGSTCSNPVEVNEGTHFAPTNNYFYKFQPKKNGIYKISTCDAVNKCDTKIWIYEQCKTFLPLNNGAGYLKYNDDNPSCDTLAEIDQIILNNIQPYTIRIGGNSCLGKKIKWRIEYLGVMKGCRDSTACNYNQLAEADGEPCIPQNSATCKGADLTISQDSIVQSLYIDQVNANLNPCYVSEGCLSGFGLRQVLRFSTMIANIGDQDYYIGKTFASPFQFVYDECHQHYHYKGYAEYLLFDKNGKKIPIGYKAGFCVLDLQCAFGIQGKYTCNDMGISKKCFDIYDSYLDCQWIDLTDVKSGKYTFVARVNWDNSPDRLGRMESRIDNNWAQVCLDIKKDKDSDKFTFKIDSSATCKTFTDCKGVPYGNNVPDCEGVCAGKALFGDLNKDGKQDAMDSKQYVQEALNDGQLSTCNDLNDDGIITVADASLLVSCINIGKKHAHIGAGSTHDHCRFPQKVFKQIDTVTFKIQNYNPSGKYFDVSIKNPTSVVNAFQLNFANAKITNVKSLMDSVKFPVQLSVNLNKGTIIGISHADSVILRSSEEKNLIRVYFNNTNGTKINLDKIIAVTDQNGYSLQGKIEKNSLTVETIETNSTMYLNPIVYPHPINNEAIMEFYNPENERFDLEIFDICGKKVHQINNITNSQIKINRSGFQNGFYVYRLKGEHGFASGKLIFE